MAHMMVGQDQATGIDDNTRAGIDADCRRQEVVYLRADRWRWWTGFCRLRLQVKIPAMRSGRAD